MKTDKLPYIYIVAAGILWGAIGITVRELASYGLTGLQIVFTRFVVISVIFGVYIFITDREKFKIDKTGLLHFALLGIACILAYCTLYTVTIQLTSFSVAAALLYTSPIWAMLLSIPVFKEKLTIKKAIAVFLCFLGCALISGLFSGSGLNLSPIGLLTGILSGMGYGSFGVFAKKLLNKYDSITTVFYPFLFASIGALPFCGVAEMAGIIQTAPTVLTYIFFAALICYLIPYALYTYSLNYVEASRAAVIVSVEPVFAAIFGFILFSEPVTLPIAAGILLILSAIFILRP